MPKAVWGQTPPDPKLDESLRESLARGCTGIHSVIIRAKPGYRAGLRTSLEQHGNLVSGEFPALEAVTAQVSCDDLRTLAGFTSTNSISANAPVGVQRVDDSRAVEAGSRTVETDQEGAAEQASTVREREGQAARRLKRPFFATMATPGHVESDSDQQIANPFGEAGAPADAFGGRPPAGGGAGVGVAIIDSGIEPGTDFDSRISYFYDFTQGDIRATAPNDGYGHGTHVAGLIGSRFVGIAPDVRFIGLKVLDAQGRGTTDNVVRAIEFAIANRRLFNIQVLNLSLGHPIFEPAASDPLVQAVEHAVRQGLVVVVSAGNFGINPKTGLPGYAGIASPGNAPSCISVGAVRTFNTVTRTDDRIAPYSSRGPSWYDGFAKPDIVAPGDNLLSVAAVGSTLRVAQEKRGNVGDYMRLSGTSMAAGVASGVVALVLQANHGLTPNTVKAVLEFTAIPVKDDNGVAYDALTQGAGDIEVAGAVSLARSIHSLAPVGSSWLSFNPAPSTVIGRDVYAWSQEMIWGNHIARGSSLLAEQRPAWALAIVCGEGLDDFDNIVWGNSFGVDSNLVWGNSFDAGDNIVWGNNIVWAHELNTDDNIVWGNSIDDNIVWGNNVVWGTGLIGISANDDDNIVWGNLTDDNIVWGNLDDDNIVWGNLFDDNIVWGNSLTLDAPGNDDNIVWGNSLLAGTTVLGNAALSGNVMQWTGGVVAGRAENARARRTRKAVVN